MSKQTSIPKTKLPYAIIIGLDSFTGLQSARILHANGVPVIGISHDGHHACAKTNVCKAKFTANLWNDEFVELLEHLGPEFDDKPVLYPCSDQTVMTISEHRERLLPYYRIALPDHDTLEMLVDKVRFYKFAQKEGFPIPQTYFLDENSNITEIAEAMSYPCMLKPPYKNPEWLKHAEKVIKVDSPASLIETFNRMKPYADLIILQQWVEGDDTALFSMNGYFNRDSEPLVTFIARKIRQWPIETGVSCLSIEERNDVVLDVSLRLFKHVRFFGLCYLEMKRDAITGEHYIIEPNLGRPTGRSAIAEAGGVALLYTKYCDMVGLPLPPNRTQTYGNAKWIYLRRDLQSAFKYWRRGQLSFGDWLKSMRGKKRYAIWDWRDPLPFFLDFRDAFQRTSKKKKAKEAAAKSREALTSSQKNG